MDDAYFLKNVRKKLKISKFEAIAQVLPHFKPSLILELGGGQVSKDTAMTNADQGFDKRLNRIGRKRARMVQGYSSQVSKDGLIVFRPNRRSSRGFPIRGLLILALGFFCFKGLLLAHLGEQIFSERVDILATGSMVEQADAFMMQADPIS